jgi:hypothetical protein
VTAARAVSARSNVVIRVNTTGTIKINAGIPQCGAIVNLGRYCGAINMSTPFVITGI